MPNSRSESVAPGSLDYNLEYHRETGWRVTCTCGGFSTTRNSFDSGMFYELSNHIRDHHEGHNPYGLVLSPFDMLAFVEYFDHIAERSIVTRQWKIGIAVLVVIGMIPIVWSIVDRILAVW